MHAHMYETLLTPENAGELKTVPVNDATSAALAHTRALLLTAIWAGADAAFVFRVTAAVREFFSIDAI